jgi:hypothetical protein
MRDELDKALVEKYPLIFKNRYGNMQETAMCWGFECGDGWYNILDTLCSMLSVEYNQAKDSYDFVKECLELRDGATPWKGAQKYTAEDLEEKRLAMEEAAKYVPVASQVKEKYGTLRFYIEQGDDRAYNLIGFAESLSARTCEECGRPGLFRDDLSWWRTLCDNHYTEYLTSYMDYTEPLESEK